MKSKIISVISAVLFLIAIGYFALGVYTENKTGEEITSNKYENLLEATKEAAKKDSIGSFEFKNKFFDAVGDFKDFSEIELFVNNISIYRYPKEENKVKPSEKFVKSFSKSDNINENTELLLNATVYKIKQETIYNNAKVSFILTLAGTILSVIVLLFSTEFNKEEEKSDSAKNKTEEQILEEIRQIRNSMQENPEIDEESFDDDDFDDDDFEDEDEDFDDEENFGDDTIVIPNEENQDEAIEETSDNVEEESNEEVQESDENISSNELKEESQEDTDDNQSNENVLPNETASEKEEIEDEIQKTSEVQVNEENNIVSDESEKTSTYEDVSNDFLAPSETAQTEESANNDQVQDSTNSIQQVEPQLENAEPELEPKQPDFEGDFKNDLEISLKENKYNEISLVLIKLTNFDIYSDKAIDIFNIIKEHFEASSKVYKYDGLIEVILNGVDLDTTISYCDSVKPLLADIMNNEGIQDYKINIGISAVNYRAIPVARLVTEAEGALRKSEEDPESPIIAFKANPDKYKEEIGNELGDK